MRPARPIAQAPIYKLYGENQWPTPDMVHCESIAARSRLHDWQIRLHRHHGLMQWLYLQKGQAQASLNGPERPYRKVPAGSLIAVPQMCTHGFRFAPDARGYVVTLGYPLLERLGQNLADTASDHISPDCVQSGIVHVPGQPRVLPVVSTEKATLDALFACLHNEYQHTRPHRNSLMQSMLTSLLVWISRQLSNESSAPAQSLNRAQRSQRHVALFGQLLEKHYHQNWSVAHYAAQIGVTPAHLNVLCHNSTGQSALGLIHQRRLLEAKRMLVYTAMHISAIADALGFTTPAYFTRFFRRLTGHPPRQFRQQATDLLTPG